MRSSACVFTGEVPASIRSGLIPLGQVRIGLSGVRHGNVFLGGEGSLFTPFKRIDQQAHRPEYLDVRCLPGRHTVLTLARLGNFVQYPVRLCERLNRVFYADKRSSHPWPVALLLGLQSDTVKLFVGSNSGCERNRPSRPVHAVVRDMTRDRPAGTTARQHDLPPSRRSRSVIPISSSRCVGSFAASGPDHVRLYQFIQHPA